MKLFNLLLVFVVGALFVSAVSAYSETFSESKQLSGYANYGYSGGATSDVVRFNILYTNHIEDYNGLKSVVTIFDSTYSYLPTSGMSKSTPVVAKIGNTVIGEGIIGYNVNSKADGTWKNTIYFITFDTFSPGEFAGAKTVNLEWDKSVVPEVVCNSFYFGQLQAASENYATSFIEFRANNANVAGVSYQYVLNMFWQNTVTITDNGYKTIEIIRNGGSYVEVININTTKIMYSNAGSQNVQTNVYADFLNVTVKSPTNKYYYINYPSLDIPGTPTENTHSLTVYVQNAQTGALIANTDLAINEYGTENWYNSTLEWGWTAVDLPAGNYEFYAFADGFTQFAPGRLTVDDNGDSLTLLLYPDELPPSAGNVTLQIWANEGNRGDGRYYGISNAEISINGNAGEGAGYSSGILTTNEQGYLNVEVPGNTSYVVYASKLGYIPGESRITVSTYSPVKVSVTLTTGTLPTSPPLTPTIQPTTPKPTQTTPPGSFIDTSAGGLANLFGTTLETGKTLLGFLVALAVGMGAAKQLRGGAPEFVVGFLGASFLGLVAGLIPVGFFVLIALLCGVYLGKTYIGGGDNG